MCSDKEENNMQFSYFGVFAPERLQLLNAVSGDCESVLIAI